MKIEPYYSNAKVEALLNEKFGLSYQGQDWEVINADAEKIPAFINYYLEAEGIDEKVTMLALLIASIDELQDKIEIQKAFDAIERKVHQNLIIHLKTIIYWALIGHGKNEDQIFKVTKFMRAFLNKYIDPDKIEIKTPSLGGVEINGMRLPERLGVKAINYNFYEFIDYLNIESDPENASLELPREILLSCEKEAVFTHFEIWSPACKFQYFKVNTKDFEREIEQHPPNQH